ncbi:MAG: hypothetical protein JWO19_272 [Bryobacterales bacterium]|nr:hypothetical protein [Bryobacterales bacterium]
MWRLLFAISLPAAAQSWAPVTSGTTANLRGVSANGQVIWVSGDKGTVLRSTDLGATWRSVSPPGVADLDFRDVETIGDRTAFLLSSGEGSKSRIYKTTDGGMSWTLLATNLEPKGFWDCIGFWDPTHGIIVGDPVDGRFTILTTSDGATWQTLKGPQANKDEGAFAASGSCVFTHGTREAWFGTGGIGGARVFHSDDAGKTWSVAKTPIRHDSASAGIFSLAFADALHGIAVGGDYMKPDESAGNVAITEDGGKTWTRPAGSSPGGYRSGLSCRTAGICIATGTSGSDFSSDNGRSWIKFGEEGYNAINGFAIGTKGRIATLVPPAPR